MSPTGHIVPLFVKDSVLCSESLNAALVRLQPLIYCQALIFACAITVQLPAIMGRVLRLGQLRLKKKCSLNIAI